MGRARRRRALGVVWCAIALAAGCGSPDAPGAGPVVNGPAGSGTTASPSSSTTAITTTSTSATEVASEIDPEADLDRANRSLASADDLRDGWSTKQKGTTTTTPGAKEKSGLGIECPELAALHPALDDPDAVTATGPTFTRSRPAAQLTQTITIFPTEAAAEDVLAAFDEPEADQCVMSLLGRQPGAAPVTINDLELTPWDVEDLGDGRAAFDLFADLSDENGNEKFHLGLAFVRVGRTVTFVGIFAPAAMDETETIAVMGAVDKISRTS